MKFEHTKVFNFQGAFRGVRNPYDSWTKSDSEFGLFDYDCEDIAWDVAEKYYDVPDWRESDNVKEAENKIEEIQEWLMSEGVKYDGAEPVGEYNFIGPKDMKLAQQLIKGGPEHRKFLRQIFVTVDITAPFYWWKEFDTYKVGTVANSCSTMHKLTSYPIEIDNFEIADFCPDLIFYTDDSGDSSVDWEVKDEIEDFIFFLEKLRQKYNETKDKRYWKELVRWLPEGYLQKRTVTLNYEVLRSQYLQRRNHRLTEWHNYCTWIESLPYADDLILFGLFDNEGADN